MVRLAAASEAWKTCARTGENRLDAVEVDEREHAADEDGEKACAGFALVRLFGIGV